MIQRIILSDQRAELGRGAPKSSEFFPQIN